MVANTNYYDAYTISQVISIIKDLKPNAGIGDYVSHKPLKDDSGVKVQLTNGNIIVTQTAIEDLDRAYDTSNYADYMVTTFNHSKKNKLKTIKYFILKSIVGFIIGLLTGTGINIVIQNRIINMHGKYKIIINYYYAVIGKDTIHIWETQNIHSTDSKGRKIEFIIAILSQEKRWELGSSDFLENHQSFNEFFPGYLSILPTLDSCSELIAVGVASQEGTKQNEFYRADKRADKILEILRPISNGKNLYKLNLGKFSSSNIPGETSGQRRVIICGIKNRNKEMTTDNIKYALYEGLKKQMKDKLGLELSEYSDFYFSNPY